MTRYTHLGAVPADRAVGGRVPTGETIGEAGQTRTATLPNLHHEVRVGGRLIDPLNEELPISTEVFDTAEAANSLEERRAGFAMVLRDATRHDDRERKTDGWQTPNADDGDNRDPRRDREDCHSARHGAWPRWRHGTGRRRHRIASVRAGDLRWTRSRRFHPSCSGFWAALPRA